MGLQKLAMQFILGDSCEFTEMNHFTRVSQDKNNVFEYELKDKGRLNWRKTRSNISTVKKNYQ
jgi:hypothetical protein